MDAQVYTQWVEDKGDQVLRLTYDLAPQSVVFDLGAYRGLFADQIYGKYGCKVFCFEPIPNFYKLLEQRWVSNPDIFVFNLAIIGGSDRKKLFVLDGDKSSGCINGKEKIMVECCRLGEVMHCLFVEHIDLIKINIEGEEYRLLMYMIENGLVKKCDNIQVQFHDFVKNYESKYDWIKKELSKTHELTYQYPFVWENWQIKKQ
jgi:FkbM family methyltransferase